VVGGFWSTQLCGHTTLHWVEVWLRQHSSFISCQASSTQGQSGKCLFMQGIQENTGATGEYGEIQENIGEVNIMYVNGKGETEDISLQ
jgi:hypothetical protein